MSSKVAVVICNWNKKAYLEKCLDAILNSVFTQYDIYVVDNASTDESGSFLRQWQYAHPKMKVIYNEINKGGSGGFNTGMREALEGDYDYIHLLDNDVVLDELALQELVDFMDLHPAVAAAGSKLFSMDEPNRLQEMGADIDWHAFHVRPHFKGSIDHENIPEVVECDYVPACSVLIRSDVIRQVGLMDEHFFIYWDDIEWFYRMKQAGYSVVSYGKSKAWHKMGAVNRVNTFPTYYFWRNRVHFFARYTDPKRLDLLVESLCNQLFDAIYFSNYKAQWNTAQTLLFAVEDAMQQIRGKAGDGRILPREEQQDRFAAIISQYETITIRLNTTDNNIGRNVITRIESVNPHACLTIVPEEGFLEALDLPTVEEGDNAGLNCVVCDHIVNVRQWIFKESVLYVDSYFNTVFTPEDFTYLGNYETLKQFFKQLYVPLLQQRLPALQSHPWEAP